MVLFGMEGLRKVVNLEHDNAPLPGWIVIVEEGLPAYLAIPHP
jgi:hypothetical protein